MSRRSKNFDELIAKEFENLEFAQEYLLQIVREEEVSVADALRETIEAMGHKEFAEKANLSRQAVSDFVNKRKEWSTENLAKHIYNVFKLKIKIILEEPDSRDVA